MMLVAMTVLAAFTLSVDSDSTCALDTTLPLTDAPAGISIVTPACSCTAERRSSPVGTHRLCPLVASNQQDCDDAASPLGSGSDAFADPAPNKSEAATSVTVPTVPATIE